MARAQNLLALPTPPGPKSWSGSPCVGLEGSEGGPCGPGLGLCSSLPDCGGLWELPCEGSVSTSVSQGVRGHSVLVLSEESEAICQLKPIIQGSRIPRGKGLAGGAAASCRHQPGRREGKGQQAGSGPTAAGRPGPVGTLGEHLRSLLTPGWGHSPEGVAPKTSSAGTDPGRPLGFRATARPPPPRTLPADGKPAVSPGGGSARRRAQAPANSPLSLPLTKASQSRNHCMLMQ